MNMQKENKQNNLLILHELIFIISYLILKLYSKQLIYVKLPVI